MMKEYMPVEQLLEASGGSIYILVILAAKRAAQLADGEKPLVDKASDRLLDIALEEIAQKKVRAKLNKPKNA